MNLTFRGMALQQYERPAKGNYPASVNVTFLDISTGGQFEVNSPVAVDPKNLLVQVDWEISGFQFRTINFKDKQTGEPRSFEQKSCKGITGQLVKA
jgi:hypothetical protein